VVLACAQTLHLQTDTSRTLGGDSTLMTLESRLRSAVFHTVATHAGPLRMGDLGVTFQRDGKLKLDQAKFEAMLSKDYKAVSQTLTGVYKPGGGKIDGFIDVLDETAKNLLSNPSGVLSSRKNGLQSSINQIDRQKI
jgi:flagellar hook-associated protein 2